MCSYKWFIALSLLLARRALAQCPRGCTCPATADNLVFEAHCKNASLTELPTTGQLEEALFIDLSFNNITSLKDNTFQEKHILKLVRLYLSNNRLKTIEQDAFRGLTHLVLLSLEMNEIETISPNLFEENTELEVLNLSANQNLSLPDNGFDLPHLNILSMKFCGLTHIPEQFFKKMLNLEYVFLKGNKLSVFDQKLIEPLTNLKKLDLSENQFTTLQFDLRETFPEHLRIDFDGNPVDCGCEMESVYALNKDKKLFGFLTCGNPTNSSLHSFLLASCNSSASAVSIPTTRSPPVSPLEGFSTVHNTSTTESTQRVIVPVDRDGHGSVNPSDRKGTTPDMDSYTGWIALSAVVLAFIIMGFIMVVIRRNYKKKDYAMPRRFTMLEYDDDDDDGKSFVT